MTKHTYSHSAHLLSELSTEIQEHLTHFEMEISRTMKGCYYTKAKQLHEQKQEYIKETSTKLNNLLNILQEDNI